MCGICGITFFNNSRPCAEGLFNMNSSLKHRGPDGEGFALVLPEETVKLFSSSDSPDTIREALPSIEEAYGLSAKAGLGHRRFSIIEPTAAGHQPWYDENGKTILVFNGEIYNYVELREELNQLGFGPFRTNSDTEVLSVAYRAWGANCFQHFNGFWAIALYDLQKRQLLLCRDRFGKKPLYLYRHGSDVLYFSSEIRSIMSVVPGGRKSFTVDWESALLYLLYDRRNTLKGVMWKDIELLPDATLRCINIDSGQYKDVKYWSFPKQRKSERALPLKEAIEGFKDVFYEAVRLRLRADVPLAANLSGGMDSSSVVAVAQNILGADNKLETDLIRYRDAPELDEHEYANAAAQFVGSNHRENFISSGHSWSFFESMIEAVEEPVHHMGFFTQWLGWKAFTDQGIKVILHGACGDELLCGYPWLVEIDDLDSLNRLNFRRYYQTHPFFSIGEQKKVLRNIIGGRVFPRLTNPLRSLAGKIDYRVFCNEYTPQIFNNFFNHDFMKRANVINMTFNRRCVHADANLSNRIRADFEWLRIPYWCNTMDKSMMEIPVEVRMPFLDYRLVEFTSRLPISYIYRNGWTKYILREAMEGLLPPKVLWRTQKQGFLAPTRKWLDYHQSDVEDLLHRTKSTLSAFVNIDAVIRDYRTIPYKVLWRITNLAKWLEVFTPQIDGKNN